MGAAVLFPEIASEQALPMVIKEVIPPFLGGIVLAALLCAVMSSADTCLLSASTILAVDVIKPLKPSLDEKKILSLTRWGIVILGALSLVLAWRLANVISSLLFAYTVYTAGITLPVIVGFFKNRLKVTSLGALAAVIGGGATGLTIKLLGIYSPELNMPRWLELIGLLVCVILLFVVSAIDNRRKAGKSHESAP
jgi:SSS family solute:Na+ symporter